MDVFAQREEIDRRKKLYESLQAQAMQQPINATSTGSGLAQVLMKLGTAYFANKGMKGNSEESSANNAEYQKQLGNELSGYMDRTNGKAGEQMSEQQVAALLHNDQAPQLADPIKADPKAALVQAMTSRFPEMQQVGKTGMANLGKPSEETFGQPQLVRGADGSLQNVLVGNRGTVKPMSGYSPALKQEATAGGNLFEPYSGKKTGFVGSTFGAPTEAGGAIVQANNDSGKLDQVVGRPPVTSVNVSNSNIIPKGETKFSEKMGEEVAKEFTTVRAQAQQAYKTLGTVQQLKDLDAKGVYAGPTANIATTLGQFASAIGVPVDMAKLANSEAYQRQFSKEIAGVLMQGGGVGRSMTDEDRKRFEASLPSMLQTPEGRAQIYAQMEQESTQSIKRAESFQQQLEQNPLYKGSTGMLTMNPVDNRPGGLTVPPQVPVAPGTQSPGGGVRNWRDYLGAK